MKSMVISFLFFFSVSSSYAYLDFDFNPISDKIINVTLSFDSIDRYDVKIFSHSSTDDKITSDEVTSKILWGDEWQSGWKYISSSFPSTLEYSILIEEYDLSRAICVRLRKDGNKFIERCKNISVYEHYDSGRISLNHSQSKNVYSKLHLLNEIYFYSSVILVSLIILLFALQYMTSFKNRQGLV